MSQAPLYCHKLEMFCLVLRNNLNDILVHQVIKKTNSIANESKQLQKEMRRFTCKRVVLFALSKTQKFVFKCAEEKCRKIKTNEGFHQNKRGFPSKQTRVSNVNRDLH